MRVSKRIGKNGNDHEGERHSFHNAWIWIDDKYSTTIPKTFFVEKYVLMIINMPDVNRPCIYYHLGIVYMAYLGCVE